ncbi:MAG: helix-turn-helix domain-containing protein [Cyanobacteria bacterium SZAS LIN-3]|nr:helix-turn-helix domain-containing protein [Cyanobacteria bacterium SZAS LIN-3]MBS2006856.1 helix-turn-helix domain-containing protein [Cyanobacteria bacterium SZAS TMP-1]
MDKNTNIITNALPKDMDLGDTLARRLTIIREWRGMTVKALARDSHFSVARLQDIETGMETWLSSSDRQLLALALKIDASLLQDVEARPRLEPSDDQPRYEAMLADLRDSILSGVRELECPQCGDTLRCRVQEGLDIDGQPVYLAKAFCQRCPFVLK